MSTPEEVLAQLATLQHILTELLPQRPPDLQPGDLVQVNGFSQEGYAGLPALVRRRLGHGKFACSLLVPHRGGATWNYEPTELIRLPELPTPPHRWLSKQELGRWFDEFCPGQQLLNAIQLEYLERRKTRKPPAKANRPSRLPTLRDSTG